MHAHHQVALVGVVDDGRIVVELALQLERGVVDGGLEVAVLRVYHQPHVALQEASTNFTERLRGDANTAALQG